MTNFWLPFTNRAKIFYELCLKLSVNLQSYKIKIIREKIGQIENRGIFFNKVNTRQLENFTPFGEVLAIIPKLGQKF